MSTPAPDPSLIHLSPPATVSMGDAWFDVATLDHFWIRRRFDVFRRLCRRAGVELSGATVGEIGCGSGLVQEQVFRAYGTRVDGFDLNEYALRHPVDPANPRFVYDIHQRHPSLGGKYDVVILFDVIEHVDDDGGFVDSAMFHLKPGGHLVVNVPALQWLYSEYDRAAGHVRRYSLRSLARVLEPRGSTVARSYWGLPYLPLLMVRKLALASGSRGSDTIRSGFAPPSKSIDRLLGWAGRAEPIPQGILGTSAMAILRKA